MGTDFNDGEGLCVRDLAHREKIAVLFDSVAPDVKKISSGSQQR